MNRRYQIYCLRGFVPGFLFGLGLGFVLRVVTLRCALSQAARVKSIFIFCFFWGEQTTTHLRARLRRGGRMARLRRGYGVAGTDMPKRCLMLNSRKQPFTPFYGDCGAKFSKILKKFDTQDYADLKLARVPVRSVAAATMFESLAVAQFTRRGRASVAAAASLKQSVFHTKPGKVTKGQVWSADALGPDLYRLVSHLRQSA